MIHGNARAEGSSEKIWNLENKTWSKRLKIVAQSRAFQEYASRTQAREWLLLPRFPPKTILGDFANTKSASEEGLTFR